MLNFIKEGEIRPQYSILKQKASEGIYQQILFSEFSRLDRKPAKLLKSIEFYQSHEMLDIGNSPFSRQQRMLGNDKERALQEDGGRVW